MELFGSSLIKLASNLVRFGIISTSLCRSDDASKIIDETRHVNVCDRRE